MIQKLLKKIDSLGKIWISYLGIVLITVALVLVALRDSIKSLLSGSSNSISSILSSCSSGCAFIAGTIIVLQILLLIIWIASLVKCVNTLSFAKRVLQFQKVDSEIFDNVEKIKNYLICILVNTILWIIAQIIFTVVFLFIILDIVFKTLVWKKAKKIKKMINYIS